MWRSSTRLPRSEEVSPSFKVTPFLRVVRHTAPGEGSPSGQWLSLRGHGMFRPVPLAPSEEAPGRSRAGRPAWPRARLRAAASGLPLCLRHPGCAGLTWRSGPAWSRSCTVGPGRQGVFRPVGSCPQLTQRLPERHTPRLVAQHLHRQACATPNLRGLLPARFPRGLSPGRAACAAAAPCGAQWGAFFFSIS